MEKITEKINYLRKEWLESWNDFINLYVNEKKSKMRWLIIDLLVKKWKIEEFNNNLLTLLNDEKNVIIKKENKFITELIDVKLFSDWLNNAYKNQEKTSLLIKNIARKSDSWFPEQIWPIEVDITNKLWTVMENKKLWINSKIDDINIFITIEPKKIKNMKTPSLSVYAVSKNDSGKTMINKPFVYNAKKINGEDEYYEFLKKWEWWKE